jgi:hypothetical protein
MQYIVLIVFRFWWIIQYNIVTAWSIPCIVVDVHVIYQIVSVKLNHPPNKYMLRSWILCPGLCTIFVVFISTQVSINGLTGRLSWPRTLCCIDASSTKVRIQSNITCVKWYKQQISYNTDITLLRCLYWGGGGNRIGGGCIISNVCYLLPSIFTFHTMTYHLYSILLCSFSEAHCAWRTPFCLELNPLLMNKIVISFIQNNANKQYPKQYWGLFMPRSRPRSAETHVIPPL